jgi:hypothetical protein
MHVRHDLLPNDYLRRLRFSQWFNQKCEEDPDFLDHVVIGDEASFVMDGEVNWHNVRRYAPKGHPREFNFNRSDCRAKLTVWAGLCGNGVILGPYFFEGNVDGVAYLQMLHEYVLPLLPVHFRDHFENGLFGDLWWAQDGALAHRLLEVRDRLNGFSSPPRDVNILRQRIIAEFNALRNNPNFITNAVRHMQKRTTLCVERNGGHVEGHGA